MPEDVRRNRRVGPRAALVLFVVDASDSMGNRERLTAAKAALLALLRRAYLDRHRLALIVFQGHDAKLVLPPTRSLALASARIRQIPLGGATPLALGLHRALQLVCAERVRHAGSRPLVVLLSDGEANVALSPGGDSARDALAVAGRLARRGADAAVLDTCAIGERSVFLPRLARRLGGSYHRLHRIRADTILDAVSPQLTRIRAGA